MFDVALALAAGFLTIAAPCVLPMLPIILGASVGHRDPMRPLLITLGFAAAFSLIAFLFGLFPSILGLSQEMLHDAAVVMLLLFGALMVWPYPFELLSAQLAPVLGMVGGADAGKVGRGHAGRQPRRGVGAVRRTRARLDPDADCNRREP